MTTTAAPARPRHLRSAEVQPAADAPKRAVIYVRISRDRQGGGLGVDRQLSDCRELAKRMGLTVVDSYIDNDMSAYSGKPRKGWLAMLRDLSEGKAAVVLCWHTDRLYRSMVELESYIDICQPREVPTACVKAGDLDLTTAQGRMMSRQMAVYNRYEVEHMAERIRRKKADTAAAGQYLGGPRPFGFEPDGITVRESEAAYIRDAASRILAGETCYSVARSWSGVVPKRASKRPATYRPANTWTAAEVKAKLTNPRIAGLAVHHGEVIGKASWPALVDEETWRVVSGLLTNQNRKNVSHSQRWLGSGIFRCGRENCGAPMRSGSRKAGVGMYRCAASSHLSIDAEGTDKLVTDVAVGILALHGAGLLPNRNEERAKALRDEANALRARLRLLADMVGDGDMDRANYLRQKGKVTDQLEDVTGELSSLTAGSVLSGVADADDPASAFVDAPIERRRAIADALVEVTILPARRGRLPKGVDFDRTRVQVSPRGDS